MSEHSEAEYCAELLVYMRTHSREDAECSAEAIASTIREVYGVEVVIRLVDWQQPEGTTDNES